ncbi:glucosaminidase domain-containing protein [Parabacteroides sp.]
MQKQEFIKQFLPAAQVAGKHFKLNPVVILAQAAIESGWGESVLAKVYHNYFGLTGYGQPTLYWKGAKTLKTEEGGISHLQFRIYESAEQSFFDFARVIRTVYQTAADVSNYPVAYAKEIAYSRYICETNGDNREAYQQMLKSISQYIKQTL